MWFVAFACAAAAAESSGVPTPKTIAVRLRANWRATPLLLEASEFFGGEDLFWRFVEHSAIDGAIALDTDEAQHAAIERAAHDLLAPLDQRLLQTYLATSALSPRVEAQLADERARAAALSIPADAAWWAWACGRAYVPSSAETLEQFVGGLTCAAELAEDDEAHVYTPAASAGAAAGAGDLAEARGPLVTLFATPGGAPFARAHAALRGMAEAGRITYAHVHRLSPGANSSGSAGVGLEEDAPLSGYGVSLAIKNMEYKVIDDAAGGAGVGGMLGIGIDSEAIASLGGADADSDSDEDVGGFAFETLQARRPDLAEPLAALKAQLAAEAAADGSRGAGGGDGSELKVWAIADLGYQAAFRVVTAANPLSALRDISSNLPAVASTLSKVRIDPKFKRELSKRAEGLWAAGQSQLTINGRALPLVGADNDYFPALDVVRAELKLAAHIVSLGVPPAAVPSLLAPAGGADGGGGAGGGGSVCVAPLPEAGAPSPIVWLNNVERDAQFRRLPRALSELLKPGWGGQFAFIRRNVYSAIVVADPTTVDGATAIQTALALLQQGAPLRFGLVVASGGAGEGGGAEGGTGQADALPPSLDALLAGGWAEGAAAAELAASGVPLPPLAAGAAKSDGAAGGAAAGSAGGEVLRGARAQAALFSRALALAASLGGSSGAAAFLGAAHELRERAGGGGSEEDALMAMFGGGGGGFGGELGPVTREVVKDALAHALARSKPHARSAASLVRAACVGLDLSAADGEAGGGGGGGVQLLDEGEEEEEAGEGTTAAEYEALVAAMPAAEAAAVTDAVQRSFGAGSEYVASRGLSSSLPLLLLNGKVHPLGEQVAHEESMGMLDRVLMMGALAAAESDARALVGSGDLADPPKGGEATATADGGAAAEGGGGEAAAAAPPPYDAEALLRTIAAKTGCVARYDPRIVGAEAGRARHVAIDDAALSARRSYVLPPAVPAAAAAGADGDGGGSDEGAAAIEARSCAAPALTHWAVADLGTSAGIRLAASALERAEAAARASAEDGWGAAGAPPACVRVSVVHRVDPRAPGAADGASASVVTPALTLAMASAWEAVLAAEGEAASAAEGGGDGGAAAAFSRALGGLRGVLLVGAAAAAAAERASPPADASSDLSIAAVGALRAQLAGRARELFEDGAHTLRVQALIAADSLWAAAALDGAGDGASAEGSDGDEDDEDDDEPRQPAATASAARQADGYIVTNGRVLAVSREPGGGIDGGSLALLEAAEWQAGGATAATALSRVPRGSSAAARRDASDRLLRVSSWLRQHGKAEDVERVRGLDEIAGCGLGCVHLEPTHVGERADDGLAAALHVVALVDPLSRAAQRLAPVVAQLRASLGMRVTLLLNPASSLSDLPLKEFYRYTAPHALAFDEKGRRVPSSARFASLSTPHTLTLHLDTPVSWLTEPSACAHDMDNLRLADVPASTPTVLAEYRLAALLIAGSCSDLSVQVPPNGLQLVLSAPATAAPAAVGAGAASGAAAAGPAPPVLADTLVMQNLGYFQLQASPGVFALKLARGSLSEELYNILSLPPSLRPPALGKRAQRGRGGRRRGGGISRAELESLEAVAEQRVAVRSFEGATTTLLVRKKAGKEDVPLLEGGDDGEGGGGGRRRGGRAAARREEAAPAASESGGGSGGLWGAASSFWAPSAAAKPAASEGDGTIHIFSLASGQLYERFLRIMMLSVVQRSSRPVKFWLIRNFLSAGFRASAPQLAKAKGFEVEFVRYQWPPWLRAQSEKQRIIWGYKILFLDVLFPLGLKKVIYIDADQVINSDIAELWDLDLKGRAVGMTPFCSKDANPHTTGFRFWAQGYWVDHLRGRPYHISALFVIDLARFRRRASGDRYRVYYDNLSADPNSLSNLDQDLPNYAQHSVPIASLPEHWLWCETWCGNSSKAEARTIDLCNNPLTKEPKIEMAKRIIGQRWIDLDNEATAILAANATARARAGASGGAHDEL